jgi:ABC-type Fe3+/spermidine/putrescine transport system ATPase subunit
MASIRLEKVHQRYGDFQALSEVDLVIEEGEFFSLLGPSGSGKTTLLRLIAGFEPPYSGEIYIGGERVTNLPPEKRRVGMVFQNYALFPHLNVFDNVAYGLRANKTHKSEIAQRISEMLRLVDLEKYDKRDIHALSGGQQQRVALARALAPHPRVLLMDEPLSNLDARLRLQTRRQILELQKRIGMTTVYVTHDQSEALALSDRLAVLLDGKLEEVGTPTDLYWKSGNLRVADFLGEMNIVTCKVDQSANGRAVVSFLGGPVEIEVPIDVTHSKEIRIGIRPESFAPKGLHPEEREFGIESVQFEGIHWRMETSFEGDRMMMILPAPLLADPPKKGDRIALSFAQASLIAFG